MARLPFLLILLFLFVCDAKLNRPNLILVLTDDQDVALGGLFPMVKTQSLARAKGARFLNAFSTTPVCCPARSSLLTGLYQHNHRVFNNSRKGGCDGIEWKNEHEPYSLGPILQKSGYRTFYAGKYLNGYKADRVPPGWDWWAGLKGNSVYYNYTININGTNRWFADKPDDYLTDVLAGWTQDFLKISHDKPFALVVAPPSPHEPFTPSNKYKDHFKTLIAPRYPNFNAGKENKHWLVRSGSYLDYSSVKKVDEAFRCRWETLMSVDDMMINILSLAPENTYTIFTSDHGFHLGQFSMPWDKRQPYETDIRIPFIIWGPSIPSGALLRHPILNIDIAPTFYKLAGVENPPSTDGKPILPLFSKRAFVERSFRIEYHGEGGNGSPCFDDENVKLCHPELNCKCFDARNNTFTCTRRIGAEKSTIFCKFYDDEDFKESYDLLKDPYQLDNLAS